MKNISFKTILPYLVAILIFIVVTFAYLSPLLEGKSLKQNDVTTWQGSAKEIENFRKDHQGQEPLWTGAMFCGMPAYQISMFTPSNNTLTFLERMFNLFFLPHPANIVFMYFLGFFILLMVLKVDPWLSIIGALAFGFSSYFFIIIDAGHNSKATAIGYMAPVFAGIILSLRGKYLWGGVLTALFLSLELKMNHVQMTYYLFIIILIYMIAEFVTKLKEKQLAVYFKAVGVMLIAGAIAVGTNITNLRTSAEYVKETMRGQSELTISNKENKTKGLDIDYATGWSYGVDETMTLLIPDFKGGSSSGKVGRSSETYKLLIPNENSNKMKYIHMPLYWGTQPPTSGPVYAGAIFIFLFVLGLFIVKGSMKWVLLAATILSIMLSWGKNFMVLTKLFFAYFPMYDKFRAVSSILVIAELCIPLLGILAINEFIKNYKTKKVEYFNYLKYSFFITGGISLFFAIFGTSMYDFTKDTDARNLQYYVERGLDILPSLIADRKSMLMSDSWRSFFLITAAAVLLWGLVKDKLKWQLVVGIIGALVIVDMAFVDWRYFDDENFTSQKKVERPYEPSDVDGLILQDNDPNFRVYRPQVDNNFSPFNDASVSYFHKSIGGYHGAKLRRYQDLIEYYISRNNVKILNMLNTKYFIVPDQNKELQAQRNVSALGNAWFVDNYKLVDSPDSEIVSLSNFEPATTAIVDKRFKDYLNDFKPMKDSLSTIKLLTYQSNDLVYQANAKKDEFAVFSEIYYEKGWKAYIDDKEVPHIRVNYVLRALKVPQGNHKIEFKFHPDTYYNSEKIGYASSLVLVLMILGMLIKELLVFFKKDNTVPIKK